MKPIMMSTEDARGVVNGMKTMMRQVMKPQPVRNGAFWELGGAGWSGNTVTPVYGHSLYNRMPYKPSDVLYVREAWRVGAWNDEGSICVDYKADGFARREWLKISDCDLYEELWQQSSDDAREANATIDGDGNYTWMIGQAPTRWRSPVTMPREAARLFLRVTDVRVERVQDITDEGSIKEGCTGVICDHPKWDYVFGCADCMNSGWREPPRLEFSQRWDTCNAKSGYGWDSNPWTWAIEFEKCDPK